MATALKNLSDYDPSRVPDASTMKFGVVVAEWNLEVTGKLMEECVATLKRHGVKDENITVKFVPGSFELPAGAQYLLESRHIEAVICIGCVIKGETSHNEYINHSISSAISHLNLAYKKPVIFGVLTPDNMEQAKERAGGKYGNKGVEAAVAAIKMLAFNKEYYTKLTKVTGFGK